MGRLERRPGGEARSLLALVPPECRVGEVFRPQPNGHAELVVMGTGLSRDDAILWNGRALPTSYGSSRTIGADVAPALVASPGEIEITVEDTLDPSRPKLRARFVITR